MNIEQQRTIQIEFRNKELSSARRQKIRKTDRRRRKQILARAQRHSMQEEQVNRAVVVVGDEVHRSGISINYRCAQNAHYGEYIVVAILVLIGNRVGILTLPENGSIVGIKCVNAVVLSRDVHHIVNSVAGDGLLHDYQRLGVHAAVERDGCQQAEGLSVHIAGSQCGLSRKPSGAQIVVVVGQDILR